MDPRRFPVAQIGNHNSQVRTKRYVNNPSLSLAQTPLAQMQDYQFNKEASAQKINQTYDGRMDGDSNNIHYWAGRRVNGERNGGFNKIDDVQAKWSEQLYTGGCFNPHK